MTIIAAVALVVLLGIFSLTKESSEVEIISYTRFNELARERRITVALLEGGRLDGKYSFSDSSRRNFRVMLPQGSQLYIANMLRENGIEVYVSDKRLSWVEIILISLAVILVVLLVRQLGKHHA